jgi:hypothetical protein
MSFNCEFCKNSYTSLSILKSHQKTTKFCLDIQESLNKENINKKIFLCEYCNKEFNKKSNFDSHLKICKIKIEKELQSNFKEIEHKNKELEDNYKSIINKYKELVDKYESILNENKELKYKNKELVDKHESVLNKNKELEKELIKYETIISSKEDIIKELKNENKELKDKYEEQLKSMYKDIKDEYKQESKENKNLLLEHVSKPKIVNNYNVQFNNMFEKLEPFTDNNVKNKIDQIPCDNISICSNEIEDSFITNFIEHMKDFTFCTDSSRGTLIIKLEDGEKKRINSEKFISECFTIGKDNLLDLITKTQKYIDTKKSSFDDVEYLDIMSKLLFIANSIKQNNCGGFVTTTSNKFIKFCPQINKSN